jgi:hypothetical protein
MFKIPSHILRGDFHFTAFPQIENGRVHSNLNK